MEACFFSLCQMACVFKARINSQFDRAGNLKGVAGLRKKKKKKTKLYPFKCRSKGPTSSTFSFNWLSKSNVKILTISLELWCLW